MAKTRSIQSSFLSGELSPLVKGSVSLAQYYQGAEQLDNVVIVPQGGVKRRGGLEYMQTNREKIVRATPSLVTMPNGGTAATINDEDSTTTTTTTVGIGSSPYIVAQIDLGSVQGVEFVDFSNLNINLNGATLAPLSTFSVGISLDDVTYTTKEPDPVYEYPLIDSFDSRIYIGEDTRYIRLHITDITGGLATVTLGRFDVYTSNGNGVAKLIDFNISEDVNEKFMLVLTDQNMLVFTVSGGVAFVNREIKSPYLDAEVAAVRAVVSENVCLLFHENHPTQRLVYQSDAVPTLSIGDAPYANVPLYDFNDSLSPAPVSDVHVAVFSSFAAGQTYQIDVEGILSKQITYSGDGSADAQSSTAFNIKKNLQAMPNFGESGITVARTNVAEYTITIGGESAGDYELFSAFNTSGSTTASVAFTKSATGTARREPVWGVNRGYPRMGAFFEGRLWLGGTRDKKQSLMASKSGDLLNFDTGEGDDDESIFITITSRTLTEIVDIYPGRNLQIFTSGGEYAVLEADVTPASINVRSQTTNGSLFVPSQEVDGAVIFFDRNGKTLREYTYTFNEDAYASADISVLSSHLIDTPVDGAFLTGSSSDDANWLFIVNSDGSIAVLNKLRSQDINGFTKITFPDTVGAEAVAVLDDSAFFVMKRDGEDFSTVERFNFDRLTDGSVSVVNPGIFLTDGRLKHLVGMTVSLVGDGMYVGDFLVDADGNVVVDLGEISSYSQLEAGINFIPTVQPMPINSNIGSGMNVMRLKKTVRMNVRVLETTALYVDDIPLPTRSFGGEALDQAPRSETGILGDVYPVEGWSRETMPIFTCQAPTKMHIQAIDFEVESS